MSLRELKAKRVPLIAAIGLLTVSACNHNDDDPVTQMPSDKDMSATYSVMVTNITNGQPLTPVAVVVHNDGYMPWQIGAAASPGIEMLAESGDNTMFIAESEMDDAVVGGVSSDSGPFGPGASVSVDIEVSHHSEQQISIATMLANTNDAFTGVANLAVGSLDVDDSVTMLTHVYDAGTEANTESAATIPGPAGDNGEGYNMARDDTDMVSIHGGVVTMDDGLMASALDEGHRWLGPAAKVVITRTQ